jgi:hypothetical protein
MDLPMPKQPLVSPYLLSKIKEGKAILFLGAGASYGCTSADGKKSALMGADLGKAISKSFLGGQRETEPLAKIADYAIADSSLLDVQLFVRGIYESIEPRDFHSLIPKFKWKAIVTTNYDRVIEKAYERTTDRIQTPVVLIRDGDIRLLEESVNTVPIMKIHGCITGASDTGLPLILANEQYAKYQRGRGRLVVAFREWAKDYPVIFCGYEMNDAHIAQILFSLEDGNQDRPSYAAINPRFDDFDRRHWSRFKMEAVSATFEQFLASIDATIPLNQRVLAQLITGANGSLSRWLKVGATLSHGLQAILGGRLKHIHHDMPIENPNAESFYKGDSESWAPIKHDFDFPRSPTAQILADSIAANNAPKFVLVKGHAGSGKTVVLKRAAWELSGSTFGAMCFYCDTSLKGVKNILQELYESSKERIYIFVDNALFDKASLNECYAFAKRHDIPVTIVAGARTNEWNAAQTDAKIIPTDEYTIGDLSSDEAGKLCGLLEKHKCLGELGHLAPDKRVERLMGPHERQLLVTLHEATMGAGIREILRDEFRRIIPVEAQILYLDICSLHRLGVPVRAGLVSRMSGTSFLQFQERFLSPLEKVVSAHEDWRSRDYAYRARHVEIAQIVFEEAFPAPADKANQIARIVGALNTDYSSDNEAATKLLKGKRIAEEFADRSFAERIFEAAEQTGIDKAFVLQQRALFELKHPGGSAVRALRFIETAIVEPKAQPSTLHHTKAVVLLALSREAGIDAALADRYRENALAEIKDHGLMRKSEYGVATYCDVLLAQVEARIDAGVGSGAPRLSEEAAIRKMSDLERNLNDGLQRWPDDVYLMGIRAKLFTVLSKHPQALAMLRAAFKKAPANEYVALRLARQLIDSGEPSQLDEANEVLRKAVDLNAASKALNFQLARLLMRDEVTNAAAISKLLRRSYTDGDTHFEAQFWSARHEFLHGDRGRAMAIYAQFRAGPVPYGNAGEHRGFVVNSNGIPVEFDGSVRRVAGDFAFVDCSAISSTVFLHCSELKGTARWTSVQPGDRLKFKIAFSFRGPCCVDAHI